MPVEVSHSHSKHTDGGSDITQTHPLSIASSFYDSYAHKHVSAVSNQLAGRCLLMPHISSHVWPAAKIGDQSLFTEEMAVCGRKMRGKRGGTQ